MNARDLFGKILIAEGVGGLQSTLLRFEDGAEPPSRDYDLEPELSGSPPPPSTAYRGRKCAKCGKTLNGGGLQAAGWGLLCWDCWHSNLGRRDGRNSLSSDASGERNTGYNWRR